MVARLTTVGLAIVLIGLAFVSLYDLRTVARRRRHPRFSGTDRDVRYCARGLLGSHA